MNRWCALCLVALGGCGQSAEERPQWLLAVSTDARVPQLGDRVLVEVLGSSGAALACDGCRQLFGVTGSELPIEIGIVPSASGKELRARARLLRSSALDPFDTEQASAAIDRIGLLTDPAPDRSVSLQLAMACFGIAADAEVGASCDPQTGALAAEAPLPAVDEAPVLVAGSWDLAADRPCLGTPDDASVCIPGGSFLLGDLDGVGSYDFSPATIPERLVVMSPFFLDRDEYTVGRWHQLAEQGSEPVALPGIGSGCTFTTDPDPAASALPLNCVSRALAEQICAAEGKRLPTEAEWEFAASNRMLETRYPWGTDDDVCAHAVVSRGDLKTCLVTSTTVLQPGLIASGVADDVTLLGVRDLGGNVAEWVTGKGAAYDAACFEPQAQLLFDPHCDDPAYLDVARGGHWRGTLAGARATSRAVHAQGSNAVGFRCARSDSPAR